MQTSSWRRLGRGMFRRPGNKAQDLCMVSERLEEGRIKGADRGRSLGVEVWMTFDSRLGFWAPTCSMDRAALVAFFPDCKHSLLLQVRP